MKSSMSIYRGNEKAQALVEFALTMGLLLLLVLGILEVGRLLFYVSAITSAAREGARFGSAAGGIGGSINYYEDCDGIRAAAARIGQYAGVRDWNVSISYDDGSGSPYVFGCGPGLSVGLGDRIVVTVEGDFEPFVGFVDLPPYTIKSVSRRTIVKDVDIYPPP